MKFAEVVLAVDECGVARLKLVVPEATIGMDCPFNDGENCWAWCPHFHFEIDEPRNVAHVHLTCGDGRSDRTGLRIVEVPHAD